MLKEQEVVYELMDIRNPQNPVNSKVKQIFKKS